MSDRTPSPAAGVAAASSPRVETEAVRAAVVLGALGALYGLAVELAQPGLLFADGPSAFAVWVAAGAGVAAGVASGAGYWRSRSLPEQQWRSELPTWKVVANTGSVILVHAVLAFIQVYVLYRLLGLGFIGLPVGPFWSIAMMAITLGLTAQLTYRSVSRMTTERMSSLLRTFIAFGIITSMILAPEPDWWQVHFSHLGTFRDGPSGLFFNGTLIGAGFLVTTFAVYLSHDMRELVDRGVLVSARAPRITTTLFVVMGAAFAGVGIVPVDVNRIIHDVAALGLAAAFFGMLIAGSWFLRGMPRTYFVYSWTIAGSVAVSGVLFALKFFSLTAIEIIVFVLIFGWISVFVRFLGVAERTGAAISETNPERSVGRPAGQAPSVPR